MPRPATPTYGRLSRRDPAVAGVIHAWRRLTSGAREARVGAGKSTLVAVSGGADSCALLLSLVAGIPARGGVRLVVGHVVHDLRAGEQALADRDAVAEMAERLGVAFTERTVTARGSGEANLEAAARTARYTALVEMARDQACGFVATGHHAGDQLETVLMSLLRGTGAAGIRGFPPKRRLAPPGPGGSLVTLIRPMASRWCGTPIDHETCERLCGDAGVEWREDATNTDESRLRNAVRRRIVPALREIRPDALRRGMHAAEQGAAVAALLHRDAGDVLNAGRECDGARTWTRAALRPVPAVVLGQMLLDMHRRARQGRRADRCPRRRLELIAGAIRDKGTDPRRFDLAGLTIEVTAAIVRIW